MFIISPTSFLNCLIIIFLLIFTLKRCDELSKGELFIKHFYVEILEAEQTLNKLERSIDLSF